MKLQSSHLTLLCLCFLSGIYQTPSAAADSRTYGGIYTEEKVKNLRQNIEKYDWARKQRDAAVEKAKQWVEISDEKLWDTVPGQDLPRCIDVTWDYKYSNQAHLGCLKCGDKIAAHGNYPYEPDCFKKPWKLTCPSCGVVFPTNDFGKYYRSGLDEHGEFKPARADRSLLFNTEHPDPADPLHKYGVDDGFGYVDDNGRAHKFIGYYTWKFHRTLNGAAGTLAEAYLYSGEKIYARKAAILLDRMAELYPAMDWNPYALRGWYHSDGMSKLGKVEGSIWEAGVLAGLANSYDKCLSGTDDNPELLTFLAAQSKKYALSPKGTREQYLKNVDDNLLRCAVKAIHTEQIKGNFGMRQRTIACCALALNQEPETTQWIDWIFAPDGGKLTSGILEGIDRDGMGSEAAPGYALSVWANSLTQIADLLEASPGKTKRSLYRDFPNYARMCTAGWRLLVLDWTTPNIGDSGYTGSIGKVQCEPDMLARPFKYAGDKEAAIAAYRANGNKGTGILRDIYAENPNAIAEQIDAIGSKETTGTETYGMHMAGYGLASLEFGKGPEGKAFWLYYGRNGGHGHQDQLNFGLYSFGHDLTPDLGYPEFASTQPERRCWTGNTISHNTVIVDHGKQKTNWTGFPHYVKRLPGFGAMEIHCPNGYPQTKDYTRTILMVEAPQGNAYALDVFRVQGGNDHLLSFHGPPGTAVAEGLNLVTQTTGTYAGEDVPPRADRPDGYSFLQNVARDNAPAGAFRIDWKVEEGYQGMKANEDIHLRWHVLSQCNDVALADGQPPRNKKNNPASLRYALLHRKGQDLASTYVSVLEPYQKKPFIASIKHIGIPGSKCIALQVDHTDGTVDYLLTQPTTETVTLDNGLRFNGSAGFVRVQGTKPVRAVLVGGTELAMGAAKASADTPAYTGTVLNMDNDMRGDGELWVDTILPEGDILAGEQILIENDRERSACYEIAKVVRESNGSRISCGPVSFVRGLKDPKDEKQGFTLDFEKGARFTIPRHADWQEK